MHSFSSTAALSEEKPQNSFYYRLSTLGTTFVYSIFTRPMAFFGASPILNNFPHVRAKNPVGFTKFNLKVGNKLTGAAKESGLVTLWIGPIPMIYVTHNEIRHALIQESRVGSVDVESTKYLSDFLMGGNKVMKNFPAFMNIYSETYQMQRKFLYSEFHTQATQKLADIEGKTVEFLKKYAESNNNQVHSVRDFVTLMILHTSSHLLCLNKYPLDMIYLEHEAYKKAIDYVAYYGVSGQANSTFEETLYQLFLDIFQKNFTNILHGENFIRNIFDSMRVPFPENYEAFLLMPEEIRRNIAMSFSATALGGLVHSTTNILDWAIANLLKDPLKSNELSELMKKNKDINLSDKDIFDKEGELYPIAEYVLHNVFLYPPFSHELFVNSQAFSVTLSDGTIINVPKMSVTLVNYSECNKSDILARKFSDNLAQKSTVGQFITKKEVASFGGSNISTTNHKTRVCPAAKTSLYEQMIIIAALFRDYSIETPNAADISSEIDPKQFPIYSRINKGSIILKPKYESEHKLEQSTSIVNSQLGQTLLKQCTAKNNNEQHTHQTSICSHPFKERSKHSIIMDFSSLMDKLLPAVKMNL